MDTQAGATSSSTSSGPSESQHSSRQTARPTARPSTRSGQPTAAYLNFLGIKVRDFAYENTLPPVQAYRIQPTQVQPGLPRPLRRQSTEPNEPSEDGSQPISQGNQSVERKVTEPIGPPATLVRTPAHLQPKLRVKEDPTNGSSSNQPVHSSQSGAAAAILFLSSPLTPLPSSPFPTARSTRSFELLSPTNSRSPEVRYALRKRKTPPNMSSLNTSKRLRTSISSESLHRSHAIKGKSRNTTGNRARTPSKRKRTGDEGNGKRRCA